MIKYVVSFLLLINVLFAEENLSNKQEVNGNIPYNPNVDCLILEDENSIICKFEIIRDENEQQIIIHWVSPTGEISRTREMLIQQVIVLHMITDILMVEKMGNGILK